MIYWIGVALTFFAAFVMEGEKPRNALGGIMAYAGGVLVAKGLFQ
jgi:hypothetical protein